MKILEITKDYEKVIRKTAEVIKAGGLVVFPSDTVYILAVDPTNQVAVNKLLGFKNRWTGKAISVAVLDMKMAMEYVEIDINGKNIYTNLLPGPFTIVSQGKHKTAKGIEAENGTLGVRIPDNKYVTDLVKILKKPITATSANLSGRTPNYSIASFLRPLSNKKREMIDLIVDAGKLPKNKPSTVIDITCPEIKVLRRGDLVTGKKTSLMSKSEAETEKIAEFLLKKALNKFIDLYKDIWTMIDSLKIIQPDIITHHDIPKEKSKQYTLISNIIAFMIDDEIELFTKQWKSEMPHFNDNIFHFLLSIHQMSLHTIKLWLTGNRIWKNFREFYIMGTYLKKENISLKDNLSAKALSKKHIWIQAREKNILHAPLEVYTMLESNNRNILFYDKITYFLIKVYEHL